MKLIKCPAYAFALATLSMLGCTNMVSLTDKGVDVLDSLTCNQASVTGSGQIACTVKLNSPAPSAGLVVRLSSGKNATVTVPASSTVPANARTGTFAGRVSGVTKTQTVTLSATALQSTKTFQLTVSSGTRSLKMSATSLTFGSVLLNTTAPAQAVTLTSSGTAAVTISAATLTNSHFTLSGVNAPLTLNPGQSATLDLSFKPTVSGEADGQLRLASNASTGYLTTVNLIGTGIAKSLLAVSPASASAALGKTLQFAASMVGGSTNAITWAVSGTGCSGTACGTISSNGLYQAPVVMPSPASVTVTASNGLDSGSSASAKVTIVEPEGSTYYLATAADGGRDSNDGLSAAKPWLTPQHNVNCGDVIIAKPSASYDNSSFHRTFGSVTCPSGTDVAWLKCATFDGCLIINTTGWGGMQITSSYWGVQGWEVQSPSTSSGSLCFATAPNPATLLPVHHVIFANNIANGCPGGGFGASADSSSASMDYFIFVGNIVYDAAQSSANCYSGINIFEPANTDTLTGTHIYIAGNFSYENQNPNQCAGGAPSDGEGIILDTFQQFNYSGQVVVDNNIFVANGGRGWEIYKNEGKTPASVYFRHNTSWGNTKDTQLNASSCGDSMISVASNIEATLNLAVTNQATSCAPTSALYAYAVYAGNSTDSADQNLAYSATGSNYSISNSSGFAYGKNNVTLDPGLYNPVAPGSPRCSGYSGVPACMAEVISDFKPTNGAAAGYGYQPVGSTPVADSLFPQWLCDVTNLPTGLVTMGCKSATTP